MTAADIIARVNGRDIYEVANQLEGYVDEGTPERLAQFLLREGKAASDLADEIVRLRVAAHRFAGLTKQAVEEAFHQVAMWHDKNARLCLEASRDEPRMNADDRRRAFNAYEYHAASAAAIRNKMIDERRAAIRALAKWEAKE